MFRLLIFFFFNDTATTEIYTLSLHDALPIYLGVHADPRLREALEPREDLGGDARAPEQRVTQRRVGRVHGDVERREPLLDDALERRLVEIGERDVVAVEERQPEVVVLDVEAPPHPLRE